MDFTTEELVSIIRYSMPDGMKDQAELGFYKYVRQIEGKAFDRGERQAPAVERRALDEAFQEGYDEGYEQAAFDASIGEIR